MPRFLLSVGFLILIWPLTPSASNLGIAAFEGVWQGNAVSESAISTNFRLTSRDIDITVRGTNDGGFGITWNTVQRQKGDPNNPRAKLKSTSMQFSPVRYSVWRSNNNNDPVSLPTPYAWAFINDRTLEIVTVQIYQDGNHETQIYRRTLSGTGMALEFSRTVSGKMARKASGRLIKVSK